MKQSLAVKTFEDLFAELGERARIRPPGSSTVAASRFSPAAARNFSNSAPQSAAGRWRKSAMVVAAEHESDDALAEEISQLLYWTQVLMIARGLTLDDVYRKL